MKRVALLVPCALAALGAACKKPAPTPVLFESEAGAESFVADPPRDGGAVSVSAPRCQPSPGTAAAAALGEGGADLEIGEAVATKSGFAVGVIRKTDAGIVGSVALVSADLKSVRFVNLGAPYGDAPPPRPMMRGDELLAALYVRKDLRPGEKPSSTRELHVFRVAVAVAEAQQPAKEPQPAFVVSQGKDDSLVFDAAFTASRAGVFAWDEDAIGMKNGDIKTMAISDSGKLGPVRIASSEGTNAEQPRIVARGRGRGYWVVWVASRPEEKSPPKPDAAYELEGPGEARSFYWLEAVALDEQGAVEGKVRRLTSTSGHVSMFDLAVRPSRGEGEGAPEILDVLAKDDDQARDGSGGRIVRITLQSGSGGAESVAIVSESVGRSAPDLLVAGGGSPSWLAFSDTSDHVRLVPLDDARVPLGPVSVEEALAKARPLLALSPAAAPGLLPGEDAASPAKRAAEALAVLAAYPAEGKLRLVACTVSPPSAKTVETSP